MGVGQLRGPYLVLTAGLLAGAALVGWGPLAIKKEPAAPLPEAAGPTSAWGFRHLRLGMLAVLVGAGVQTGLGTFFIPFGGSLQRPQLSNFTVARLTDLTEGVNWLLRAIGQPAAPPFADGTGFTIVVGPRSSSLTS